MQGESWKLEGFGWGWCAGLAQRGKMGYSECRPESTGCSHTTKADAEYLDEIPGRMISRRMIKDSPLEHLCLIRELALFWPVPAD